ncbi:DIK2A-like protein [Mya arenaria]|uniref:DIK2A-like protein n=1 Tax=Mya arenaria TaxID=6604 RepID=A0ABY7G344_MYAAR|nr:DIK2A-like protein [Mya arenaria]
MIPFTTRNRKLGLSADSDSANSEMISTLKRSTLRLKHIPLKAKCFIITIVLLAIYLGTTIYLSLRENRLTKEEFLDVYKCPACYGHSFCFNFFDNQFDLTGISKYSMLDVVNVKNVHFAFHKEHNHRVVLKKLAHTVEIKRVDDQICTESFREPGCDVARRFVLSTIGKDISKNGLQPKHFKDTTFIYQEKYKGTIVTTDINLQLLYTARVNPEPLMLQVVNPKTYNDLAESVYTACQHANAQDCLNFDTDQLCSHQDADHNYYAACRNMLSSSADNRHLGGLANLLHDIPDRINSHWDLDHHLNSCVRPSVPQGRVKSAHHLMLALEHIRDSKSP